MPKSTVHDIIKKYIKNKSVEDKPRQDRSLVLKSLLDRKITAPLLQNMWKEEDDVAASVSTVKRRLKKVRLNGTIAQRRRKYICLLKGGSVQ